MVTCSKCKTEFESYEGDFYKATAKRTGFDSCCKSCKAKSDSTSGRKLRDARRYAKYANKNAARIKASKTYNASYKCAVINCECQAEELHHVDYNSPLDVVPLCRSHHVAWHVTVKFEE